MNLRTLLTAAAVSLATVACGGDADPPVEPNAFQAFDDEVDTYLAENGLAGATAVIRTDDGRGKRPPGA